MTVDSMIADTTIDIMEADLCKITGQWKQCTNKTVKVAKEEEEAITAMNQEIKLKG